MLRRLRLLRRRCRCRGGGWWDLGDRVLPDDPGRHDVHRDLRAHDARPHALHPPGPRVAVHRDAGFLGHQPRRSVRQLADLGVYVSLRGLLRPGGLPAPFHVDLGQLPRPGPGDAGGPQVALASPLPRGPWLRGRLLVSRSKSREKIVETRRRCVSTL